MSTAENKGVSKISSGGPKYFSLKITPGEGGSLNKNLKYFTIFRTLSNRKKHPAKGSLQGN